MAIIGYARVSSESQKLDIQLSKLREAGCVKIFSEKISAVNTNRMQLKKVLDYIHCEDTLVVTSVDRLSRSLRDLLNISKIIEEKQANLIIIDQQIDTTTPIGKLAFNMLGVFSEFENQMRKHRQEEGISYAKETGVKFGRKNVWTPEQIKEMYEERQQGSLIREIMEKYNISRASLYRLINEHENSIFGMV